MESEPTRRQFFSSLIGTALTYSLLTSCSRPQLTEAGSPVIEKAIEPIFKHWAIELNEYCNDLRLDTIPQDVWQSSVERLFSRIELEDFLRFIDLESLIEGFKYPDVGVATKPVIFPPLEGLPNNTVFIKKIFGLKKGRAIVPHGHSNMASAHLVVKGDFALKHYEKAAEEKHHLIIKPTIDKTASAGSYSSISDARDNVHWFVATSETAFTFDVIMLDLNGKEHEIHNLDINESETLPDGSIRARKIDVETALKKYGKQSLH